MPNVIKEAGKTFRELRENTYGMTMGDVEARTKERFGDDGMLHSPQVSRIERGIMKRPPSADDLAKLGLLYNLSPTELFELYGLPVAAGHNADAPISDVRLRRAEKFLASLPKESPVREQVLAWINFAVTQGKAMLVTMQSDEEEAE